MSDPILKCPPSWTSHLREFNLKAALPVLGFLGFVLLLIMYYYGDQRWELKSDHATDLKNVQASLDRLERGQEKIIEHLLKP